eukprot:8903952-Pyramimonas_sp.AAC.1
MHTTVNQPIDIPRLSFGDLNLGEAKDIMGLDLEGPVIPSPNRRNHLEPAPKTLKESTLSDRG